MDEFQEERHLKVIERKAVVEMAPPIDAPCTRVDEVGPSETVASPLTESVIVP